MLDSLSLAHAMIRINLRYASVGRGGRLSKGEVRRLTPAEAHRHVIQVALPSVFLLTPVAAVLGFLVGQAVGMTRVPWAEQVLGLGIAFVPAAVGLTLNAFLWFLRFRGDNSLDGLLSSRYGRALWGVSVIGYLLALCGAVSIHSFNP